MKYKKGQWYEVFGEFPNTWYIKFDAQEKQDKDFVHYTERICRDNTFDESKSYTVILFDNEEYMKEVSLEVVSPYLPEGHLDKLPEEDKYYYVEEDGFFMIGKVDAPLDENDSDEYAFRGYCHYYIARNQQSLHRGESWCYKGYNRTFRLATQEEIDWLEYCNKIDKYVTKEEFLKQTKIMKKEDFTIEGPESLKRAFVEEGKFKDSNIAYSQPYLTSSDYVKGGLTSSFKRLSSIHFRLPQDWDIALEYVKNFWKEETKKSLYFGDVEFICDREAKAAATSYGKVTLEDIEKVFTYLDSAPKLAGYTLEVNNNAVTELTFGCKKGKLEELQAIADFLRG